MKTKFEEIVDVNKIGRYTTPNIDHIVKLAEQEYLSPATDDKVKTLLISIDNQFDFHEGGPLGVPGAIGDTKRLVEFIYKNICHITCILSTGDMHVPHQIFFASWWKNSNGAHPAPFTQITFDDVMEKRWFPVMCPKSSILYLKALQETDASNLCIWPYHCLFGTIGGAIETQLAQMIYFHSVARKSPNNIIFKGNDPCSEMYGIIKPEFSVTGQFNTEVIAEIQKHDKIIIVGQAASHCVLTSLKQIAEHFADANSNVLKKITVLEDCTSPISGYEDYTKAEFAKLKHEYGINFAKSTDNIF